MLLWHGMLIPFGWDNCTNKSAVSLVPPIRVVRECSASTAAHGPQLLAGPVSRHLDLWPCVVLQRLNNTEPCIGYTAPGPSLLLWANKCRVV